MIVIKCTKAEMKQFINCTCPERFNTEYAGVFSTLCGEHGVTNCKQCWDKYVSWVITDAD